MRFFVTILSYYLEWQAKMDELIVEVSEILDGNIEKKYGGHYFCMIRTKLKTLVVEDFKNKRILSVKQNNEQIFCGIIFKTTKPVFMYGDWEAVITAYSAGFLMDQKLLTHTYQNKSPEEIIRELSYHYEGDCTIDGKISEAPKGFYLQNMETDWAFLQRLAALWGAEIRVDWKTDKPKLFVNDLLDLLDKRRRFSPVYFYRGTCYTEPLGVRGSKSLIRSGDTETLYEAADASYLDDKNIFPPGWTMVDCEGEDCNGFRAITLRRNNNVIVAFAGSNDGRDWLYNLSLDKNEIKSVLTKTREYISKALLKFPKDDIYITGHSLGGHLALEAALYLASKNQFRRVKRIEVFNGYGPRSELATDKNIEVIQSRTYTREYRLDVVSEFDKVIGQRNFYNDGSYEAVSNVARNVAGSAVMGTNNILSLIPVEQIVIAPIYSFGINHSIKKFRQHFQYHPVLHDLGPKNLLLRPVILKGNVVKVDGETFKVKFEEDRLPTEENDCFVFCKSSPYLGVSMMPSVGETAVIQFSKMAGRQKNAFEMAICVNFERNSKK